jgi:hypothetical protein
MATIRSLTVHVALNIAVLLDPAAHHERRQPSGDTMASQPHTPTPRVRVGRISPLAKAVLLAWTGLLGTFIMLCHEIAKRRAQGPAGQQDPDHISR